MCVYHCLIDVNDSAWRVSLELVQEVVRKRDSVIIGACEAPWKRCFFRY